MAKNVLKFSLSRLIFEQNEKNFRSSLSILTRFDKAKKSSHAILFLVSKDAGIEARTAVVVNLTSALLISVGYISQHNN
jgi:hypothetical protein